VDARDKRGHDHGANAPDASSNSIAPMPRDVKPKIKDYRQY
jgi:hypothetical protein